MLSLPSASHAALGDVLGSFPAPGFYCNGLTWDGTHLWAANIAAAHHPGNSGYKLYRIETAGPTATDSIDQFPRGGSRRPPVDPAAQELLCRIEVLRSRGRESFLHAPNVLRPDGHRE